MQDLTLEEIAEVPTCNLAETIHSTMKRASGNKMTCPYEATIHDMIRAFMQITNYRAWLKGGKGGTGPSSTALKLKAAMRSGDPNLLAEVMKTIPGAEDLPLMNSGLEGAEIFGSTKRKLNLPPGSEFDSHRPDKVNYSVPRPSSRATRARIEDSFNTPLYEVTHVTGVHETDCDPKQWHIARTNPKSRVKCQAMQVLSGKACEAQINKGRQATCAPTYTGLKKPYGKDTLELTEFWFCPDDIKRCVMGRKKFFVKEWPPVPTVWPIQIGTNLSREEVLALEDAGFQLEQRKALSPRNLFRTIPNLPILLSEIHIPENPDSHAPTRYGKVVRRSPHAPDADHRNKWESSALMNGYNIVGVTIVPHPGYGAVISFAAPTDNIYRVSISNFPNCTCPDFIKMSTTSLGKKGKWVNCKHLYYLLRYYCKLDYTRDAFMHAPTWSYREVIHLLQSAQIVDSTR